MSYNDTEIYIFHTLYGIIPQDLWDHQKGLSKDPFSGYSEREKRIAKRRFRKLKRKARVKKSDSARVVWSKINWMLNNKYEV